METSGDDGAAVIRRCVLVGIVCGVIEVAVVVVLVAACGALAGGLGYWAVRIGRNR